MNSHILSTLLLLATTLGQFCHAETSISLLTHGPGEELYSSFGHSALRVTTDSTDVVYNYGVFDYNDPKFLQKFVFGRTDYYLDTEDFESYMRPYQREGRYTHEQVLKLDSTEKIKTIAALQENALEQNKYYRYDFLRDNCSTRILDLLISCAPSLEVYDKMNFDHKSYRKHVDQVYKSQYHDWLALGVRILFGRRANLIPTSREMSFLPEQLENLMYKSTLHGQPIVGSSAILGSDRVEFTEMPWYMQPRFILSAIALILLILFMRSRRSLIAFDVVYVVLGLLGILILFLGLFTENPYLSWNRDILWANPLFIAIPFLRSAKHHWYKTTLSYSLFIVLVLQFFMDQPFPPEIIPVVLVLWLSMIRFRRFFKHPRKFLFWKR